MANFLANVVDRVVVDTSWLPTVEISKPFSVEPGTQATAFQKLMKPRVTIYSSLTDPIVMAPYGVPESNWPMLRMLIFLSASIAMVTSVRTALALRDCRRQQQGRSK